MACQFLKLYCTRASRLYRLGFPFFDHFPSFPWFACCRCSHLFIGYAESYSYPVGECVLPLDIITKPPPCPETLCASCWVYLLSKILKSTPAVLIVSSQNSYKEGLWVFSSLSLLHRRYLGQLRPVWVTWQDSRKDSLIIVFLKNENQN